MYHLVCCHCGVCAICLNYVHCLLSDVGHADERGGSAEITRNGMYEALLIWEA